MESMSSANLRRSGCPASERVDCERFAPDDRARREGQLIDAPKQLGSKGRWLGRHLFDNYHPFWWPMR